MARCSIKNRVWKARERQVSNTWKTSLYSFSLGVLGVSRLLERVTRCKCRKGSRKSFNSYWKYRKKDNRWRKVLIKASLNYRYNWRRIWGTWGSRWRSTQKIHVKWYCNTRSNAGKVWTYLLILNNLNLKIWRPFSKLKKPDNKSTKRTTMSFSANINYLSIDGTISSRSVNT